VSILTFGLNAGLLEMYRSVTSRQASWH